MTCEIIWNGLSLQDWQKRFAKIRRSNMLQSYPYAQAVSITHHQKPAWGLIKINNKEAGLVQILEASTLFGLLHAVILDRGPLWFEGFGSQEDFEAFCETYMEAFPRRFGRKRRFMPEINHSQSVQSILYSCDYYPINEQKYETIWINLEENEQKLLKNLKKKWKSSLNKAQKSKIIVEWDDKGEYFDWLLAKYHQDKIDKNYDGPSLSMLKSLATYFMAEKNMVIGRALINDKPIAAILIFCHGTSATYQVGWSSQTGRTHCAHHLLLWDSLTHLKTKGIKDFDLGGINDETAQGVKKFKEGMGGDKIHLSGLYS